MAFEKNFLYGQDDLKSFNIALKLCNSNTSNMIFLDSTEHQKREIHVSLNLKPKL